MMAMMRTRMKPKMMKLTMMPILTLMIMMMVGFFVLIC